ncbi:hypothetical protein SAY87_020533 [Trapa incisa]|uniref:HD-ZIP protein N-terminal domain-containing protein n=1 Tax=Trapa incisa TaxID=236973 RepID=A0AAN7JQH5_9MYRT|nr:hypothetical protein SAY87_020533 [Trapa incisa]
MADKEDLGLSLSLSFRPHHHYHQQKVPLHLNLMPFPSTTSSPSGFASSVPFISLNGWVLRRWKVLLPGDRREDDAPHNRLRGRRWGVLSQQHHFDGLREEERAGSYRRRSDRIKQEGIVPWNQPRGGWRPLEEEAEVLQEPGRNPRGELQRAQYSQPGECNNFIACRKLRAP